jgi:hypothetical protein
MILTPLDSTDPGKSDEDEPLDSFNPIERRLSRMLDRAHAQLEASDDPAVTAVYRKLVDELEALIS